MLLQDALGLDEEPLAAPWEGDEATVSPTKSGEDATEAAADEQPPSTKEEWMQSTSLGDDEPLRWEASAGDVKLFVSGSECLSMASRQEFFEQSFRSPFKISKVTIPELWTAPDRSPACFPPLDRLPRRRTPVTVPSSTTTSATGPL